MPVLIEPAVAVCIGEHHQIGSPFVFAKGNDVLTGFRRIAGLAAEHIKAVFPVGNAHCRMDHRTVFQFHFQRIQDLPARYRFVSVQQVMIQREQLPRDEAYEAFAQAVYAANTVTSADTATENYLTVDTETGPVGLLLTRIQPTVKGVAVVCDGGDDPTVCARVTQVVATAFHISDRRVCVVKQD